MANATRTAVEALGFAVILAAWFALLAVQLVAGVVAGGVVMLGCVAGLPEIVLALAVLVMAWRLLVVTLGGA